MRVYWRKHRRTLLTWLIQNRDLPVKIADQNIASSNSSKQRCGKTSVRLQNSSRYAVISNEKADPVGSVSTVSTRRNDDSRYAASLPTSDKISYCCVCLKTSHTGMQYRIIKASADRLQKLKNNFEAFDYIIESAQSYYCRGCGVFRGGGGYKRRWVSQDERNASQAADKQSNSTVFIDLDRPIK